MASRKAYLGRPFPLPLLLFFGLIVFILISQTAPFKDKLLTKLFPKPLSQVAGANIVAPRLLGHVQGSSKKGNYYSANVWDMAYLNDKIYIAQGDAINNSGPIKATYLDISSKSFKTDQVAGGLGTNCPTNDCFDEEGIYKFRLIDGTLFAPGGDAKGSMESFYKVENGSWVKHMLFRNTLHAYDMYKFDNKLFISLTTNRPGRMIEYSEDNGQTWKNPTFVYTSNGVSQPSDFDCAFNNCSMDSFFELAGRLYASNFAGFGHGLLQYQGNNTFLQVDARISNKMFPGNAVNSITTNQMRVERPVNFKNQLVYIGTKIRAYTDGHLYTADGRGGLFKAGNISSPTRINLIGNADAWDIKIGSDNKLYVLGSILQPDGSYIVVVDSTSDLNSWDEILRFNYKTFARSFEFVNGKFYFGMGALGGDRSHPPSSAAGDILEVSSP